MIENQLQIGIFNDSFPPIMDGVAFVTLNYAYWLKSKGEDVRVITPDIPNSKEFIQTLPYPVLQYNSLAVPQRKPYRLGLPHTDWSFMHALPKQHFDIVHTHCPFSSAHLAKDIAKEQHIPFIASFHTKYREDFVRGTHSQFIADQMIKNVVSLYESAYQVWIPQATVEPTLREYGYKGEVVVVENGNDFVTPIEQIRTMRAEMRQELGVKDNELMFLYVGQHIWEKNLELMIDALAQIKDLPFHLFTCGAGYAEGALKEKVNTYGLQDKVTFLGIVRDRERLKRIDAAADLFLFPSLYDTAPLTIREAAAMHTASVMIAGSTPSEVITDNLNGFLTENNAQSYAQALRQLIEHPERISPVAEKASTTLTRSWENVIDEVRLRYRDIIHDFQRK